MVRGEQVQLPATIAEAPPLTDLRHAMMGLPVAEQQQHLSAYKERRDFFRDWLLTQLKEGVHYGFPPGCEPKSEVRSDGVYFGNWNRKKNAWDWHHESQWKPKPSLYAAGADFICDLMGVRDDYESDKVAWEQMGSKAGTAVQKCTLISRSSSEIVGHGIGAYHNAYDANNAVKMAAKCAKVGAVINAYGLRDLFTQEEPPRNPTHENPEQKPDAPKSEPRGKRKQETPKPTEHPNAAAVKEIANTWRREIHLHKGDPKWTTEQSDAFAAWVHRQTKRKFNPSDFGAWFEEDIRTCQNFLNIVDSKDLQ